MLTVTGTIASIVAAVLTLPAGRFLVGPPLVALVLVADSFDGILARATGQQSAFGAFLDSTLDRLADGAVLGSLAAWAALHMEPSGLRTLTVTAAITSVVAGGVVPYARARAESVGATASIGIAERTDRLAMALLTAFAVGLGAPQWVLTTGLVVVAAACLITVAQRVLAVRAQLRREPWEPACEERA